MASTGEAYLAHRMERPQPHSRRQEGSAGVSASTIMPSTYIGIGVGVGGAILIALVVVLIKIVRKRIHYGWQLEALQVEQAVDNANLAETSEVPRPLSSFRCSGVRPLNGRAGWDALYSDEAINELQTNVKGKRTQRSSVSLPKRLKQRGIQLKRLKRLTAIMESPRSKTAAPSPALNREAESRPTQPGAELLSTSDVNLEATLRMVSDEDVFLCPESPRPHVLPSFAIRSPGRYGSGIALNDTQKAARSHSVSALLMPPAQFASSFPPRRPPMHSRSISLGGPTSRPPSGPVPPLPSTTSLLEKESKSSRRAVFVSRMSSSSNESMGSSVLVTSPILQIKNKTQPQASPSVEQVVAEDDAASLKTVSQRQWSSPTLGAHTGSDGRPPAPSTVPLNAHHSIWCNIARYSINSQDSRRASTTSTASADDSHNRLSIPQIGTADRVSISRVSSASSLSSVTGVRKVTTPRRASRMSVSASGSPAARKKTPVLRDVSANSIVLPARQASSATDDSSRSSNGNPFQWDDQPLPKPSALKGSPNARKGHRRQNCVRISTLTPQILGPPPTRPTSPSIMHGIEEESGDVEGSGGSTRLRFVSNKRHSRPNSMIASAPNLRVQTLRASITPSSPTLSAWNAYRQHGLPSEHSDSSLSISPEKRSNSRRSTASALSIPSFPSPVKPSLSVVQLQHPVPEFCLSRPSTDIDDEHSTSPFALHESSDSIELPSSPPVAISSGIEYDPTHPAWPLVDIPAPQTQEYDPESPPTRDKLEPERSSPYFAFAASELTREGEASHHSSPVSAAKVVLNSDSPPCSPKTMPEGFKAFFDDHANAPRAAEKLTSENASAVVARMPAPSRTADFPGASVLAPPKPTDGTGTSTFAATPTPPPKAAARRARAVSNAADSPSVRLTPPLPVPSNDGCIVSPLHVTTKATHRRQPSPQGPREQPAQSMLKNAMALRRMNSEINCNSPSLNHIDRESQRYVRLGREASPLLPWMGGFDFNEGMDDVFDSDLAASSDAGVGAEEGGSVMDEINIAEIERKLDGALAGFDALPPSDASHDTITSLGVVEKSVRRGSVREDGERYWEQENIESGTDLLDVTPVKGVRGVGERESDGFGWGSIQCTPRSLYDSDGFLKT